MKSSPWAYHFKGLLGILDLWGLLVLKGSSKVIFRYSGSFESFGSFMYLGYFGLILGCLGLLGCWDIFGPQGI